MNYSYKDMPDKTKKGIDEELSKGLVIAAVYFQTSFGVPVDIFNDWITTKLNSKAEQLLWYMNFRNKHPKLYTN